MKYYPGPEKMLDIGDVNRVTEEAFPEHGTGNVQMPSKIYVTFPHGDFRTMPAYLPTMNIAGVKIVNVHPGNRSLGLPSVMALTLILDPGTGVPQALLNATALTDMRTGAAGAVAARHLSRKNEIELGLIGTGRQAEMQLAAIAYELAIRKVKIWSLDEKLAEAFQRAHSGSFDIMVCTPAQALRLRCDRHHHPIPAPQSSKMPGSMKGPTSTRSVPMRPASRNWIPRS
jgi:alanine dehydrogenase